MRRTGPDSAQSWVVASACCFINMMMYGMARLSGVLFVASVPRFGVTREQASFPYTFANFVRNTSGPLVGWLGHRFGVRLVTALGCLLGAAGIGLCFLAESVHVITVLWGIVFGLGFGLGNILLPVSVNQHFDARRATASGVAFSGACLGSFLLPSVVEQLLAFYGLSGTFLFLSGFVLNCVPAALLLWPPATRPEEGGRGGERQSIVSGRSVALYTAERGGDLSYEERFKGLSTQTLLSQYCLHMSSSEPPPGLDQIMGVRRPEEEGGREVRSVSLQDHPPSERISPVKRRSLDVGGLVNRGFHDDDLPVFDRPAFVCGPYPDDDVKYLPGVKSGSGPAAEESSRLGAFGIILDPIFNLVAVTNGVYCFTFVCVFTVIVDYARDLDIGEANEKYVLMAVSVGDLVGRLGLGWVTDGGHMTSVTFTALLFLCQGASIAAIPLSDGLISLLVVGSLYGLAEAGLIFIFPIIIGEYMAEDHQTVAIPSSNFLSGPACLAIPPLIGYFRDHLGAYDYLFYLIALMSLGCCLAWLVVPCTARYRSRKRR